MGIAHTPDALHNNHFAETSLSDQEFAIRQAVKRAARWLPGTHKCLAQAIAGQLLLKKAGQAGDIVIGLKSSPSGEPWDTHAWLMGANGIVLGGEIAHQFTPVTVYRPVENSSDT